MKHKLIKKKIKYLKAMNEKMSSLKKNKTYELVEFPKDN
jgi:hypothetical protein